ncbi:hypothetical protein AQV86_06010 [Nanohaloarchaea archaeon SG9]|nr:hypothetical protein AQV86_06010 [Nanohaloarchaea archaeon SG9]
MRKNLTLVLIGLGLIASVSGAEPVLNNESPENNSVIDRTYSELQNQDITLGINATNPDGDVNVSFFNATSDALIGENTSGGPVFTQSWDVNEFREHEWYVKASGETGNNTNTTSSGTFSFEVNNPDSTGPTITFDSTPDDPTLNRDVTIEGSLDEDARVEYRVDGGNYNSIAGGWMQNFDFDVEGLSNGEHTVTVRAEDRSGNTNTNSITISVADGSEVTFDVNVDQSYPRSGIPIDPDSDLYERETSVDFDFSLESGSQDYDISNRYEDGICDFRGDDGWHLGNDYFCGSEVPANIDIGSGSKDYELVAEWNLRGENHRRVLDSSFSISDTATWYSSSMSHGGRVEGEVNLNTEFDRDYVSYNGQKVTCTGSTYEVNNIQEVTARCSNGATSTSTPPVVAFVNRNGEKVTTNNNNMFGDNDCKIGDGVTRQQLFGVAGLDTDNQGYNPQNCNIGWTLGGDSSFEAHTFSQPGVYNVFVDYPNAISNSPDYICPARTDNNNLCDSGSISGDESGWDNVEHESVKVVSTDAEITESSFPGSVTTDVNGDTYIRRSDYSGDIQGTIEFENTGTGIVEVSNMNFDCPQGVECEAVSDLSNNLEVEGGETVEIVWTASPDGRTTGEINVEIQYDDIYGLSCATTEPYSETYYLDEADPETQEGAN